MLKTIPGDIEQSSDKNVSKDGEWNNQIATIRMLKSVWIFIIIYISKTNSIYSLYDKYVWLMFVLLLAIALILKTIPNFKSYIINILLKNINFASNNTIQC